MKIQFHKQPLSIIEQIDLLESKGMIFFSRQFAFKVLSNIGYYRFSGYTYPFRNEMDNSSFIDETSFEKIFSIYEFDRSLKSLLFSYLGRIEIAFRTQIIDKFSIGKDSPFWYTDSENFSDQNEHADFLSNLEDDIADSREEFIQHFRERYSDDFPPAWIALQIISFGTLIKLFRNFKDKDLQSQIARYFGCDSVERFISWMNTLVYLRNICSHHARLWNRLIKKRPEAYNFGIKTKRWTQDDVSKLYYSVCIIGFILKSILPGNSFKQNLVELFTTNSYVNLTKGRFLGFPKNWQTELSW